MKQFALLGLVWSLDAPAFTGENGKCMMSYTRRGLASNGCGTNPSLGFTVDDISVTLRLNDAPCYLQSGRAPESLPTASKRTLSDICPKFAEAHDSNCCNAPQVTDLQAKFDEMYETYFQECPACLRSQLEYYCNIYCSPYQSDLIEMKEVFEIGNSEDLGVQKFNVKLPTAYIDQMYESCRAVKQVWFDNVPDQFPSLAQIPKYSTTIVEQRFCAETTKCDGLTWLNNQGMANGTWPRFGSLNSVTVDEGTEIESAHVYPCNEPTLVYPINDTVEGECGCFNCIKECPEPDEVRIDMTTQEFRDTFPVDRSPKKCLYTPGCGKNLLLPNGEGQGRNDVPCFAKEPQSAFQWNDDNESHNVFLTVLKSVCPRYFHNSPDGQFTETCCDIDQLTTLNGEIGQLRQLFSRCPTCLQNAVDTFCHTTCDPSQTLFMDPVDGFDTTDINGDAAIGIAKTNLYFAGEYMDRLWDSCKDVTFPQTNGKVIEGLMCDGRTGDSCTVEVWLNFQGATSNGFSPYDLFYIKVLDTSSETSLQRSFDTRWTQPQLRAITDEELTEIRPDMVPKTYPTIGCNEPYVDPFTGEEEGSCSCQDCEASCPPLPVYPDPIPRKTVGNIDMWGFIAIMVSVLIICIFVIVVVLRKYFKAQNRTEDVTAVIRDKEDFTQKPITEEDVTCFDRLGFNSQEMLRKAFEWWARNVACRFPLLTLLFSIAWTGALIAGFKDIEFTTDPIRLWAAETSRSYEEYNKFNNYFVPFYRASQIIATLKPEFQTEPTDYTDVNGDTFPFHEILNAEKWPELHQLTLRIRDIETTYEFNGETKDVVWPDVCFNPLSEPDDPTAGGCSLFSIFQYFQNDPDLITADWFYLDKDTGILMNTTYKDHLLYCTKTPSALHDKFLTNDAEGIVNGLPCGSDFGSPIFPYLAIGGYNGTVNDYWTGQALIMNFINVNVEDKNSEEFAKVTAWEAAFLEIMHNASRDLEFFDVGYYSERSIEDEIDATSQSDLIIFVISYAVIFLYITVALGKYSTCARIPIDMKVSLALGGIIIILASAMAATGVFGWAGIASNLIVMEVVPFLILAVGADNVFILVMDIQREEVEEGDTTTDIIARVLGRGGPSMLLCALTEATVFFVGSISDMPAVKVFALNAGLAIVFNFILQVTAFLAVVKLDMDRQAAGRWDLLYCIKSKTEEKVKHSVSIIDTFFREYYTPFLMNDLVGFVVVCLFSFLLGGSIYAISVATVGLDQNLSVPKSSYVATYFDFMETYFMVGVPVYFVLEGKFKYDQEPYRNLVCGSAGCDLYSLAEQISRAAEQPERSTIETPATIWVDDYMDWIKPASGCCRTFNCDFQDSESKCDFCAADVNSPTFGETACRNCIPRLTADGEGNVTTTPVEPEYFRKYLDYFLSDNPNEFCSKGGHASYGDAINYSMEEGANDTVGNEYEAIYATYYMAYHSVCIKSVECQENIEESRYLADNITYHIRNQTVQINLEMNLTEGDADYVDPESISVWTYAIYYPYYEQYIYLAEDAIFQIGVCLIPAFILTFLLLGFDFVSGIIVIVTVTMIVVDTYGMCALWGVDFNALTLINLIAAIGISIEFTGHTTRTFALSTKPNRKARVIDTMGAMGPAVFMGVALTNLPGVICLHWAQMQLIEIFFFRMCFVTTLVGIAHGLIFLPVILAYFGPNPNRALLLQKQKELVKQVRTRQDSKKIETEKDQFEETDL